MTKTRLNKKSFIGVCYHISLPKFLTLFFLWSSSLFATATSVWWTPCTTEVVPVGEGDVGVDCYFKFFPELSRGQILSPDLGLTVGVLNWYDLKMEAGFDYLPAFPSPLLANNLDTPIIFNTKFAVDECRLFPNAPSFALGLFNIGFTTGSSLNIFYGVVGKKLPCYLSGGDFYLGAYRQSKTYGRDKAGFMIAYEKKFCKQTFCEDEDYFRWVLVADYATGKNESGAGGMGLYYYFSPNASIATGPTFFNDAKLYGSWKWTVFFSISFPIVSCKNPYEAKKEKKTPKKIEQKKEEEGDKKSEKAKKQTKDPKQENADKE